MATISSLGVGSGLDIATLVSQLVAAERAPADKRLTATDAKLTIELTALSALKGVMSSLQSAVNNLKGPDSFNLRKATVGDETAFGATVTAEAVAGNYDVEIVRLATASRLGSTATGWTRGSAFGAGELTFTVGAGAEAKSFSIDVAAGATLTQIRDAINADDDNVGVSATIITDQDGAHLVLTSTRSGAAGALTVTGTADDGDTDAASLSALFSGANGLAQIDAAQDAEIIVSGYTIHSSSNVVSGAIDGVTLNLKKATVGTVSLQVQRDEAAIQQKATGFINTFNSVAAQIKTAGGYDAATKKGGPLLGDAMLRGLDTQLRRFLSDAVPGTTGPYRTLASVGITTTATGALQMDAAKFNAALQADPEAVNRLFSSENGIATRMGAFLDARLSSTGEIALRNESITSRRRDLDRDSDALDARMLVIEERYRRQFTALDTMLSQLQNTSSYLTQQLEGLANLANRNR